MFLTGGRTAGEELEFAGDQRVQLADARRFAVAARRQFAHRAVHRTRQLGEVAWTALARSSARVAKPTAMAASVRVAPPVKRTMSSMDWPLATMPAQRNDAQGAQQGSRRNRNKSTPHRKSPGWPVVAVRTAPDDPEHPRDPAGNFARPARAVKRKLVTR